MTVTSQPTMTLVDALAEEAAGIGTRTADEALRAQAALVRAILDELGRFHPSDRHVVPLHEQLGEELARLARLVPSDEAEGSAAARPGDPRSRTDILIVDDEPSTLRATATVVRMLGYGCRTAGSSEEAIRECERSPARIIVSDWHMPGMNGLQLCQALKTRDPRTYFILVTAQEDARELAGLRSGVDDCLSKPIDSDELSRRLLAAVRLLEAVRVVEGVTEALRVRSARFKTTERLRA
jgi:CheY-like chemotaxis protein